MTLIQISNPSVSFLLQMDTQAKHLAEFLSRLIPSIQRDILDGMEEYLLLTLEDRKVQLEGCDFYNRQDFLKYMKDNARIESVIVETATACGVAPGDAFFRNRRPIFINNVVEAGRQGYISSENAGFILGKFSP